MACRNMPYSEIKEKVIMEGKECIIETRVYAPDSKICDEEICFVCRDGVWQEKRDRDFNCDK